MDGSGPPRANAAQLAARNIKSIKPRRGGGRSTPVRTQPSPQFAPMQQQGGQNGASLFGGSIQGGGSFNFTTSGPSFPPPSGGGSVHNPFGMSNTSSPEPSDNDERRDPGEERPSKKQFGGGSIFPPSNSFGQPQQSNPFGAANGQQNGNLFSFGAAAPQTQPAIGFNSAPAEKPAGNIFSFGAQSPAPSPAVSFGAASQEKQETNSFNFGQQAAQPQPSAPSPAFSFGSSAPADKPASNPFSFGQTSSQPPTTAFNFGATPSTQAPASNMFGSSQPPSTNMFGSTPQPPPPANPFASLNTPSAPPTSGMFGKREQSPAPPASTGNPFGNLRKPAEQAPNPPSNNLFGGLNQQKPPTTNNLFGNSSPRPTSPSLFVEETPKPTQSLFGTSTPASTSSNLFGGFQQQTPSTNDLFGNLNKPVDQSVANADSTDIPKADGTLNSNPPALNKEPVPNSLFGGSKSLFSAPSSQNAPSSPQKSLSFDATPPPPPQPQKTDLISAEKPMEAPNAANEPPPSGMFPSLQQPVASEQPTSEQSDFASPEPLPRESTSEAVKRIMKVPSGEGAHNALHDGTNLSDLAIAKQITEEYMSPFVPAHFDEDQRKDFFGAYRLRTLNKAMQQYFATLRVMAEPAAAMKFYSEQRLSILEEMKVRNARKRKATDGFESGEASPNKRAKQGESSSALPPASPTKRQASPAKTDTNTQPHVNGNSAFNPQALQPSQSNSSTSSISSPAPKGKRKAEDELTKDNFEAGERPARQIKTPKAPSLANSGGSNTSNIFKNILDSPSKSVRAKSPTKKDTSGSVTPSNDSPRVNPFSSLPVPGVSNKSATPTPPLANAVSSKPAAPVAPAANLFVPKSSATPIAKENTFKPPTFSTGPVNFLAQFGAQAKKDEKDNEEKLMQRAKDEDMDSDDDEAEWEANYKKKRNAELEELKKLASSSKGGFVFGGQSKKTSEDPKPTSNLFSGSAPNTKPQSPSNAPFSSLNHSRTSTPGPISSAPGSVFDGHTSGKPVSFGGNIFGHLSDSGADSGKSDDADNESGDETDPDADADSENKDPNYKPGYESPGSGAGTPVEETGAGIASAKKTNLFNFGTSKTSSIFGGSNSGTSTPGGLFDRVNKDSSGKPIRHVSTEEKENTQPSTTNVFGELKNPFSALNKTNSAPTDHTWKPDSPIRFGSATPNHDAKDSPPTFNVTAATPTKSGSPATIFGNLPKSNGPTSAPFSNLFGNTSNTKPAASTGVGFNFGGASNTSSLFPSATTSRATSPGATTDGDSAAEPDTEAEKQEQIDLTAGGPGEENEEVIHDVRAKALKFIQKEKGDSTNPWETQGVGPLRVLRHKETKAVRILLRADPRGTIVLNKGLLSQVEYVASGKTIKILTAADSGTGLETWILQVKTPEFATALAEVLESNKSA